VRTWAKQVKRSGVIATLSFALFIFGSSFASAEEAGETLVDQKCVICHTLDRVDIFGLDGHTAAEWDTLVERMKSKGCPLTDPEKQQIVNYLSTEYPVIVRTTATADTETETTVETGVESAEGDPATPDEQAQTGAEDWLFPMAGLFLVSSGLIIRRRADQLD